MRRGAFVETVTLVDLKRRDGDTCSLCGDAIEWDEPWPHPKSPSIDHVIPLSRGGIHAASNLKLAHLGCNCAKRDRLLLLSN
jgi:5-methylcytosine-specific restriction endonuclease McrA